MARIEESTTLKLQLDQTGKIWYIDGDNTPRKSELTTAYVANSRLMQSFPVVRLTGSRKHANLIVTLYFAQIRGALRGVQLCGPAVIPARLQNNIAQSLTYLRSIDSRSASVGGWHQIDENDYVSYALIQKLNANSGEINSDIRYLAAQHPAWPALTFIPHLDLDRCIELLTYLADPRWYVDPEHPDRGSRLESYLGLQPKTQRGASGAGPRGRLADQCDLVMACWKTPALESANIENPVNFLKRIWMHHGSNYMADLRTSQYFVNYLRLTWLNAIYSKSRKGESLFVPEYFFTNKHEVAAYNRHLSSVEANYPYRKTVHRQ